MFVLKRVQQPSDSQGRMGLPRQACLDHLAAQRIPRCPPPSQCTPGGRDKRLRKPFAANTDFIRSSDAFLAGRWCFQASGSLTDSAGTVPICHNKRGAALVVSIALLSALARKGGDAATGSPRRGRGSISRLVMSPKHPELPYILGV